MDRPRRVAVLGGSFNPPHVGHGMVAAWLRWADRVDEVWLVPTFAHAFGKALAPFERRMAACARLAEHVGPWVSVAPIERDLGGTSYTRRTLDALAATHPDRRFRLVIGADLVETTPRWKDWSAIAEGYAPIIVGRSGWPAVDGAPTFPAVSSTAIREAVTTGEDVSHLVPPDVLRAWSGQGGRHGHE